MPRVNLNQTNFTAGELSPRLTGRTDIDRYRNAARRLLNAHPVVHGGAKRRAGSMFFKAAKHADRMARLVPFVFSQDTAYMLEFGHNYVRVFGAGGVDLATEFTSPYDEAAALELDFSQSADAMFITHAAVFPNRLRRFSDTAWSLADVPFTTLPFDEQGYAPAVSATLSLATVGAGRTITAAAPVFLPSDVGRALVSGAGLGVVTGYTSTTILTVTITIAFASVNLLAGEWSLDVSPQAILKASAKDPVASSVNLSSSMSRAANLTLTALTGAITVNASAGVFTGADTGRVLYADSGVAVLTFVSAVQCTAVTSIDFTSLAYAAGGWGITADAWRTDDVGKYVRLNGGLLLITAFTSASVVVATILQALDSTVAAPALAWSVESSVWSAANGYPRTVTLHEQRLVFAGSTGYPQTIWGSRTGEYHDFTKGTNDDDSYSFTIANDEVNPISYLASLRNLVVHTYGGEFSMQGGIEKPITPTNVRIRSESPHGSKGVRPVQVGKESVFVQRAGRKVRAMGYRYDFDGYASPDLSVLAEHITQSGIAGMAYQQEPDMLLWAWREDGAFVSCTLDRDQQVTGWAPHYTDGAVESMATIPNGESEETWLIVRRTINGATVRYIEILNSDFQPILPPAPVDSYPPIEQPVIFGCTVDCGIVTDNAAGQSVITGLAHLEEAEVDILCDGYVMPRQTVSGGQITLPRDSYRTLIGLPFTSEVEPLIPEVGDGEGSAQGAAMSDNEITLRFLDSLGCTIRDDINGTSQTIAFKEFGSGLLGAPVELFSGIKSISKLGWQKGRCELVIAQNQPLPMHLLSVIRRWVSNQG